MGGDLVGNLRPLPGRGQHVAAADVDLDVEGQGDRVAGGGLRQSPSMVTMRATCAVWPVRATTTGSPGRTAPEATVPA